jgi:hypothetical protein
LVEARRLLQSLGASFRGEYVRETDRAELYSYSLKVGILTSPDEPAERTDESVVYHNLTLVSNDDTVAILEVSIGGNGTRAITALGQYWARYTVGGVFGQVGPPDSIYIAPGDELQTPRILLLVYSSLGAVLEFSSSTEVTHICSEQDVQSAAVFLSLYDPDGSLDIYSDGRVPLSDRQVWLPVEEVLGVDRLEFHDGVLANPEVCLRPLQS